MSEIVTDTMTKKLSDRIDQVEIFLSKDYTSLRYLHNRINRISKRIYSFEKNKEKFTFKVSSAQEMNDINRSVRIGGPGNLDSSTRQVIGSTMDAINSAVGLSGTFGTPINSNSSNPESYSKNSLLLTQSINDYIVCENKQTSNMDTCPYRRSNIVHSQTSVCGNKQTSKKKKKTCIL